MDTGSYEQSRRAISSRERDGVVLDRLPSESSGAGGVRSAARKRRAARRSTPAFVIVDEADVLRDEGEAYAGASAPPIDVTTVRTTASRTTS